MSKKEEADISDKILIDRSEIFQTSPNFAFAAL